MNEKLDRGDAGPARAMSVRLSTPSMSMTTPYGSSAAGIFSKPPSQANRLRTEMFAVLFGSGTQGRDQTTDTAIFSLAPFVVLSCRYVAALENVTIFSRSFARVFLHQLSRLHYGCNDRLADGCDFID